MSNKEIINFLVLRSIGNFLLLFALFGVGATFAPVLYYEIQFKISEARGVRYVVKDTLKHETTGFGEILRQSKLLSQTTSPGFASVISGSKEQILVPKDTDFDILIPKIGANSKIFPNIDTTSEDVYLPILKKGVAHAKGSVFPGIPGTTYLFAHSTDNFWDVGRYNAVFYLLKNLSIGDSIVIFYQHSRYNYSVSETKIVDAEDVSYLTESQIGSEKVILQTCWPPGTTWKRLLVIAKPVK